jgi:asparagine synthetase B (glutamine-hydrolysing)
VHTVRQVVEECQHLLAQAVRTSLSGDGAVWAQLSGGLDSSSVTSVAQWLAARDSVAHGLAGTVTFVDHRGTGTDERRYSDSVVTRWRIRNEVIIDPPTFYDEQYPLPLLDQPRSDLHVYPREMRMCHAVRSAGGRTLLTGVGGDEIFSGNMLFFADWLVRGRIWPAVHEMGRRAAIGRVSFWELAYRNALLPLLPIPLHRRFVREQDSSPVMPWLKRDALKRYDIAMNSCITAPAYGGPRGEKYMHAVVSMAARIEAPSSGSLTDDFLEVRHPLLYRPLVEFALRLPPDLRARPHAQRWVLREAMREILPELVRTRVGKPGTADYLGWTLLERQRHLAPLLDEPILADLGLVDPVSLRQTFNDTLQHPAAGGHMLGPLLNTLAVEGWLQHRCGRWPRGERGNERTTTGTLTEPSFEGEQRRTL